MRVFGIDPGSQRTGYGCVESDGRRHRLVVCGAVSASKQAFADRLAVIHDELSAVIRGCQPDCVAIENLFHATNVRSALKLGHARGVAMLAAVQAGLPVVEYTPAEIKRAVVGYGRADKAQVQQMIRLLLGLARAPQPHDAADALAVAICHLHADFRGLRGASRASRFTEPADPWRSLATMPQDKDERRDDRRGRTRADTWRTYRPRGRATRA
ncbi:MAG: crossover junction endodeoxyribonuclease RuvC [Acidobacteriota bacterium]